MQERLNRDQRKCFVSLNSFQDHCENMWPDYFLDDMNVLHISTSDMYGGAARAAYRIHKALEGAGIGSAMRVMEKETQDNSVYTSNSSIFNKTLFKKILRRSNSILLYSRGWRTDNKTLHSFGSKGERIVNELNHYEVDVLNLHWISNLLSVKDVGMIRKPIVWTFHDMWAFCGGEHYTPDFPEARFRKGYLKENRPKGERGPDLNRKTWEKKRQHWMNQQFNIVCPSTWMAACVRESVLFERSAVHVIPYPLDMDSVWKPVARNAARRRLGIDLATNVVLFGAIGGLQDHIKGGDLLRQGIEKIASRIDISLMIYGQSEPSGEYKWPCPVHWLGEVDDDRILATAYSAADVMVVPSRQDNLPNTAIEAQGCGTPVVAFKIGGLTDIVTHLKTGWLAKPFDTEDLAEGILWILEDKNRWNELSETSRSSAYAKYDPQIIAHKYAGVYESAVHNFQPNRFP